MYQSLSHSNSLSLFFSLSFFSLSICLPLSITDREKTIVPHTRWLRQDLPDFDAEDLDELHKSNSHSTVLDCCKESKQAKRFENKRENISDNFVSSLNAGFNIYLYTIFNLSEPHFAMLMVSCFKHGTNVLYCSKSIQNVKNSLVDTNWNPTIKCSWLNLRIHILFNDCNRRNII